MDTDVASKFDAIGMRSFLNRYGITTDMAKLYLTIIKLKKFHHSDMYEYGYPNYYIKFNIKTKILIDSLFEDSRGYMLKSKVYDDDGMPLLDITELIELYVPFDS